MRTTSLSRTVADALVDRGLVAPERADEATDVIGRTLATEPGAPSTPTAPATPSGSGVSLSDTPVRRRLAEVTAYVGAAFVVGAGVLFVSTTWDALSTTAQVVLLLGSAVVLFGAGIVAVGRGAGEGLAAVRRRLASALFTGAAASAAFGVGVQAEAWVGADTGDELPVLLGATAGLAVALLGYRVAASLAGQAGALVAAFVMVPSGLGALPSDTDTIVPLALSFVALGAVWLLAAERGWWHEREAARVAGWAVALIGAQLPLFEDPVSWVSHLATAVIAVSAFGGYLVKRAWPYLATGVVALTLVVPEALNDWFGDSIGVAGILLAAGVTLLGAALVGLRLRQEVTDA